MARRRGPRPNNRGNHNTSVSTPDRYRLLITWPHGAHSHSAINGLIAAMAMEMLRRHAPDIANSLADHLDSIFTVGDIGGPAYRTAQALGHDPDQWIADYDERAAARKADAT
ncbi:hypothetical protein XF35_40180 [Streptomyces platensis subsp. clarensis]|uniref:Uncharacterized protein n=1 Tax=Streptomyces showdoensis TaxID=68268 RepID=A0A2P2GKR5_STREW|nr:hypothetical protein [Streptomyces showdoensis]KKZ72100.1 hypothetical protein VO63_20195 [Streptomyces showdoensis]MCW7991262.1 hypothetical protein [Streptomyces platensis subsp. clarensis]